MGDERLSQQLAIRVTDEDVRRLDALKQRIAIASRNAIARSAMRLGIEMLEADPARAIREQPQRAQGPKWRRR
jgi:predicted DNA-binding protein